MSENYKIGAGIYDVTGLAAELGIMGMASIDQETKGIHSIQYTLLFI